MGKQRVLGVSHARTPGTRLPKALSSFLGTAYLFPQRLAENEQIRHGNIYDRGCILSHAPIPCKGRGSQHSRKILGPLIYPRCLTYNDQIWRDNRYGGEVCVLMDQQKCVAPFFSDVRASCFHFRVFGV